MPASPKVLSPRFGAWLAAQRGERSLEQIAIKARTLLKATGLAIDQSLIYKIERGRVPSWPLLLAFARIYNVDLGLVLTRLVDALDFPGVETIRPSEVFATMIQTNGVQGASKESALQEGGAPHDFASPRLLAHELRSITHAFISALDAVADRLPQSDHPAAAPTPARPHRPRPPRRVRRARQLG